MYVYNGGGISIGDFNNDKLPDLYFTGNMTSSRLYINKGNFKFEDITQKAGVNTTGWCTGTTVVDINSDGLLDLYICRSGNYPPEKRSNLLFINKGIKNGIPSFSEASKEYGINDTGYATQAAFFDYNKDQDLDLFIVNHTNEDRFPNRIKPIATDGSGLASDHLYRNNGNDTFTDVSLEAGILYDGMGLGVGIADIDNDGWEDIFVSNDFIASDQLYINNQDGTFTEKGSEYLNHHSHFSMGNDLADFNNDGLVDVVVLDMLPEDNYNRKKMAGPLNFNQYEMMIDAGYHHQYMRNTLHINNGKPNSSQDISFSEIGQLAGIEATDWSWAPLLADFDDDGHKDLFVTNGYKRFVTDLDFIMYNAALSQQFSPEETDSIIKENAKMLPGISKSNCLFRNTGQLTFENRTADWGLYKPSYSNGAAFGDLDLDGDLDLVVNNIDQPAFIYRNNSAGNYLNILLRGPKTNIMGLGARIWLYNKGKMQFHHQSIVRGYQSSMQPLVHFGLGNLQTADSVVVKWPDGRRQTLKNVGANQYITLAYADAMPGKNQPEEFTNKPLFTEIDTLLNKIHIHEEEPFSDFAYQPLLPHKHSQLGPFLAKADVDKNGLEDFFIGGSYSHTGYIYKQLPDGTFEASALDRRKKTEEDMGAAFFDADNDGDPDLYVASGSNEFEKGSVYYRDRLYLNDGRGNFNKSKGRLPDTRNSSSCVKPADFDRDGDMDIFVGGRLQPLQYPAPGQSMLLRNDGGHFKNVTKEVAPELENAGMVTAALWSDFDGDGQEDLIVAGEFMSIVFFKNENGRLRKQDIKMPSGWWNCLAQQDFDRDGDTDYIAGNLGLNSGHDISEDHPLMVYAADFDNNGMVDPIITHYLEGREYPVHSRGDMIRQLSVLKKKYPSFDKYARVDVNSIIPAEGLENMIKLEVTEFASIYIENLGNGKFKYKPLPIQAQVAPVNAFLIEDINNDGHNDILLAGNNYQGEVRMGRYDALKGLLLKGDGKGNFSAVNHRNSGFYVEGDQRDIEIVNAVGNGRIILVSQNSGPLKMFRWNGAQSY